MSYFKYKGKKIYYEEHGNGKALVLLHGNTVSGKFFTPVIPILAEKYHVITLDFLGCGQSDRMNGWPADLWYEWAMQVVALCDELNLSKVKLIGCSGGALAAINAALEKPELVEYVVADSFEGLNADPKITEQIRVGRGFVKQNAEFRSMLKNMHGDDWKSVVDADTEAVVAHAKEIGSFFHKPIEELKVKLLLTGSDEDEMFPEGHYEKLFAEICGRTCMARAHIFAHGGHPAMMSNTEEFISLLSEGNMIETNRLKIYAASKEQMEAFIAAQSVDVLKAAYTEMLEGCLAHPDQWDWYAIWMIELKDGVHIGELCFKGIDKSGSAEIGYGIAENYQGFGYATEAVTAAAAWALKQNMINCVSAEVDKDNIASIRVLEKSGFELTGRIGEEGPIYRKAK